MDNASTYKLVTAFTLLIIGVVLLSTVAGLTNDVTGKTLVVNESVGVSAAHINDTNINTAVQFNLTNAPTGWRITDCGLDAVVIRNATGTTLTITTDYLVNTDYGNFTLKNTTSNQASTTNLTWVDYNYCGEGYLNSGWNRSVLNLVPGFFALAILGIALMLFYSIAKDEGII